MNRETAIKELQKPLDPSAIKPPPQGKYGEYVEALHVIREANRIFGEFGWEYTVKSLVETNRTLTGDKHHVGYMATVAVVVDGVTRMDVGHGQGHGKSEGDAHDSAVKEAVTDALKRALRTFGNTFGLALYEKDKSKREVGYSASDEEINAACESVDNFGTVADLTAHYQAMKKAAPHVAINQAVIDAFAYRKSEIQSKEES